MVRLTDRLDVIMVVDWAVEPTNKQTNKNKIESNSCSKIYMYRVSLDFR